MAAVAARTDAAPGDGDNGRRPVGDRFGDGGSHRRVRPLSGRCRGEMWDRPVRQWRPRRQASAAAQRRALHAVRPAHRRGVQRFPAGFRRRTQSGSGRCARGQRERVPGGHSGVLQPAVGVRRAVPGRPDDPGTLVRGLRPADGLHPRPPLPGRGPEPRPVRGAGDRAERHGRARPVHGRVLPADRRPGPRTDLRFAARRAGRRPETSPGTGRRHGLRGQRGRHPGRHHRTGRGRRLPRVLAGGGRLRVAVPGLSEHALPEERHPRSGADRAAGQARGVPGRRSRHLRVELSQRAPAATRHASG